jgi:hypothetical protein
MSGSSSFTTSSRLSISGIKSGSTSLLTLLRTGTDFLKIDKLCPTFSSVLQIRIRSRIRRIRVFLGLLDLDPDTAVRGMDPRIRLRILLSPSRNKKNLDSYCFVTSLWLLWRRKERDRDTDPNPGSISQRHGSADTDPDPDPYQNVMNPQHWYSFKGTVRPDWICMRGFNFLNFSLEYLQRLQKFWAASYKNAP